MHEPFTENPPTEHAGQPRGSLLELTLLFLRLGSTAIGGPAVHVAMMEEEVVTRRSWLTRAEFLDFLGATNLIPRPNSTEMAIHVGRVRVGWRDCWSRASVSSCRLRSRWDVWLGLTFGTALCRRLRRCSMA